MALIGINAVAPDQRKRTTLEEIESGVNIASKVLGTGLDFYKTVAIDRPNAQVDQKLKTAQTNYYDKQAEQLGKKEEGKLSDVDKTILDSYKDYRLTHAKGANQNSISVYLPVSGRTIYAEPNVDKVNEKAFDTESKLRKEFNDDRQVQAFTTIHGAAKSINESFKDNDFERADSGRDINLLYNFIKMMDPGSTVREGEVQLTTGASPILDRVVQQYKRLKEGGLLPTDLRKSLVSQVAENYAGRQESFNDVIDHYKFLADKASVDWQKVIQPIRGLDFSSFKKQRDDRSQLHQQKQDFLKSFGGSQ